MVQGTLNDENTSGVLLQNETHATGRPGTAVCPDKRARTEPRTAVDLWVVVLAGGQGVRLQGFVRRALGTERAKQFCRFVGRRTMLRHTWDRALQLVEPARIVTIITAGQEWCLEDEAPHGVPGTVLVQPGNKETAPGVLLPLLWIARRSPTATVVVFPADHFIWEEDVFAEHVRSAVRAAGARADRMTLLGVEADAAETDYGWILPGEPLPAEPPVELSTVWGFWEKPDRETAAHLFARGCLWNTMIMAGRLEAYLGLAAAQIPWMVEPLDAVVDCVGVPGKTTAAAAIYNRILPTDFSRAILVPCAAQLMVLAARSVTWSDWGDAGRIVRTVRQFDRRPVWLPADATLDVADKI